MNYFTSKKLYCRRFSGGPVFLNIIFDFSGIFHPFGVVTRAIHCYEKKRKVIVKLYGGDGLSQEIALAETSSKCVYGRL